MDSKDLVIGSFSNRADADQAVMALEKNGYGRDQLSVIVREEDLPFKAEDSPLAVPKIIGSRTTSGVVTGVVLGGLAGLLIGIGALVIPGIGLLLIGGPIAALLGITGTAEATVSGVVTGALAGGLIGALTGIGVSKSVSQKYSETLKSGGVIIAASDPNDSLETAKNILRKHNAADIETVTVIKT